MSKSLPRSKTVEIVVFKDGQEKKEKIEVRKAGLGKWKLIIDNLKRVENLLPEVVKSRGYEDPNQFIDNLTPADLIGLIPQALSFALDEIIEVLSLGTGVDKEFLEEHVGPDEAVELFTAIVEVNNLYKVAEVGKKLPFLRGMVTAQTPQLTKKKSSTGSSGGSKK